MYVTFPTTDVQGSPAAHAAPGHVDDVHDPHAHPAGHQHPAVRAHTAVLLLRQPTLLAGTHTLSSQHYWQVRTHCLANTAGRFAHIV